MSDISSSLEEDEWDEGEQLPILKMMVMEQNKWLKHTCSCVCREVIRRRARRPRTTHVRLFWCIKFSSGVSRVIVTAVVPDGNEVIVERFGWHMHKI